MDKNLPRDTFLYLLAIIALVVVAVGFGMAVFSYIDFYFPDPAVDYYRGLSSYEYPIRTAMAMLIVVFPVFYWVSRFLRKDVEVNPEKREMKLRKWLLYLTVFAASLVIIGDLVAVVNNFLTGELTTRFILKALTIFFISGSAFYYYLAQIKSGSIRWMEGFAWLVVAAVIWAVAWGFVVIGSPLEQRNRRFDERRVRDLQTLQSHIVNYWQSKERLPARLNDMADPIRGVNVPADPKTGGQYEYRMISNLSFELCAVFATESEYGGARGKILSPYSQTTTSSVEAPQAEPLQRDILLNTPPTYDDWSHDRGRVCFERTIDPDYFRIEKPRPL